MQGVLKATFTCVLCDKEHTEDITGLTGEAFIKAQQLPANWTLSIAFPGRSVCDTCNRLD